MAHRGGELPTVKEPPRRHARPPELDTARGSPVSCTVGAVLHSPRRSQCAHYSMILSSRANIDGGMVNPSAFAALRLITRSNALGCCTGRATGLAPFRVLPPEIAPRGNRP